MKTIEPLLPFEIAEIFDSVAFGNGNRKLNQLLFVLLVSTGTSIQQALSTRKSDIIDDNGNIKTRICFPNHGDGTVDHVEIQQTPLWDLYVIDWLIEYKSDLLFPEKHKEMVALENRFNSTYMEALAELGLTDRHGPQSIWATSIVCRVLCSSRHSRKTEQSNGWSALRSLVTDNLTHPEQTGKPSSYQRMSRIEKTLTRGQVNNQKGQ